MIGQQLTAKNRWLSVPLLVSAFVGLVIGIKVYKNAFVPVYVPDKNLPNASQVGNVAAAMQQTHDLVEALRANNWNPADVPERLKYLPDAKFAEDEFTRKHPVTSYAYPILSKWRSRTGDQVAVYSSIYMRSNVKYYQGDSSRSAPSGFYLVGWKDGRVTRVPVQDVRVVKIGDGTSFVEVFPGMKEWRKDGVRLMHVELANGADKMSPEAKAFYQPTKTPECEPCKKKV